MCYMWSWQRITEDYEVLLRDQEDTKKKLEASRARNRVLSMEVKTLKHQISTLVEKGKHDDELVDALLVRNCAAVSVMLCMLPMCLPCFNCVLMLS